MRSSDGGDDGLARTGRTPFISICIPTYNRAAKLRLRFEALGRLLAASAHTAGVEIIVSNNASTDDTKSAIEYGIRLVPPVVPVTVVHQPTNIGGEANFEFLYFRAAGHYVWLCSDDDVLNEAEFEQLLNDLHEFKPEVSVSSYRLPPLTDENRVLMLDGARVKEVSDLALAAIDLVKLPNITAYVLRRRVLEGRDLADSNKARATTSFWFVALAMLQLARFENRLLLRTANIASADANYRNLSYSLRVFETLNAAVLIGVGNHPARASVEAVLPERHLTVAVVGILFHHTFGLIRLAPAAAASDYNWIRANLVEVMRTSWRNVVKVPLILVLFPVTQRLRARGRS